MGDFAPYKRVYSNFPLKGAYQLGFFKTPVGKSLGIV